jgi:catechol 2,3-dioxygenase-like lactoylglutathione lyase family enzyme
MHQSRLAGFILDCRTEDLERAATFWSAALGMRDLGAEGSVYRRLDARARDLVVEVQAVAHPSRVHVDIEADDVEAEIRRLEALGARRVEQRKTWQVMEAPTGQRFCVVRAKKSLEGAPGATIWR